MDSLTHLVLSGSIAAAVAPVKHRRAAILAGMALGTLPDLDVFLVNTLTTDPILHMTDHRGFSHSLLVMPLVVMLIWWLYLKRGNRVAAAPQRWFWAMQLALISHLLLDALTAYGTQLWWPLNVHPTAWSSIFIVDPLYTLCLIITCAIAWFARNKAWGKTAFLTGLGLSGAYIGWTLLAKNIVDKAAQETLITYNLAQAPRFSVPLPFNTLLWRVIVMTPNGYLIGDRSLVADSGPIDFQAYDSDTAALAQAQHIDNVKQLQWFNQGFMKAEVINEELILKDLRMGLEPEYSFAFAVAERKNGQWQSMPSRQVRDTYQSLITEGTMMAALQRLWQRIWQQQPGAFNAPPSSQAIE